jgi:hypothetical protein
MALASLPESLSSAVAAAGRAPGHFHLAGESVGAARGGGELAAIRFYNRTVKSKV